jgi:hypothetical protein
MNTLRASFLGYLLLTALPLGQDRPYLSEISELPEFRSA